MTLKEEITVNKYGQDLIGINEILDSFSIFRLDEKRKYLNNLADLIIQSKAIEDDIEHAIAASGLKSTLSPCILLKKGPYRYIYEKIINLPELELRKALVLLLSHFNIAYNRRFEIERNDPDKWWYWDLSDEEKVALITRT